MTTEGVIFKTEVNVGVDYAADDLLRDFDAVVLTGGCTIPRDLPVPGRELDGVHFAMDFLTQQNRLNAGDHIPELERISAEGKRVVILGGGDTGSDCLGTSHRQGAELYISMSCSRSLRRSAEKTIPGLSGPWYCRFHPRRKRVESETTMFSLRTSPGETAVWRSCTRCVLTGCAGCFGQTQHGAHRGQRVRD